MATEMKKLLKRLETENDQAEGVFSIFEKWLDEEESSKALMSYCNVESFKEYDQIKNIERQYLKLVTDLSTMYELRLLRPNSSKTESKIASFNDLYSAVSRHINHDRTFDIYLEDIEALVDFGHDFTALLYVSQTSDIQKVRDVFLRNGFHELR